MHAVKEEDGNTFFSVARRRPVNFSSVAPRSDGAAAERLQNECKR